MLKVLECVFVISSQVLVLPKSYPATVALNSLPERQEISCNVGVYESNGRAELAFKATKRLLNGNVGSNEVLNTDELLRAMLTLRNTPDPDCRLSAVQILFGRNFQGFSSATKSIKIADTRRSSFARALRVSELKHNYRTSLNPSPVHIQGRLKLVGGPFRPYDGPAHTTRRRTGDELCILFPLAAHCPKKSCPNGFLGKDCQCWCKGSTAETLAHCSPIPNQTTSPPPTPPTTQHPGCPIWASWGRCQTMINMCPKVCRIMYRVTIIFPL